MLEEPSISLSRFNQLPSSDASAMLSHCCAAKRWVEQMNNNRPYASPDKLLACAAEIWQNMSNDDYLQAFAAHPMIGDLTSLEKKYASTAATAASEQASTQHADKDTLEKLHRLNHEYRERHGFIFIIFASGKSATEMLTALEQRFYNTTAQEISNAAAEQLKITRLRLSRLFLTESD